MSIISCGGIFFEMRWVWMLQIVCNNQSPFFSEFELLNQLWKRRQFLFLDQTKLVDKENEVLEAGVQVILQTQSQNHLKVRMVDMGVYSEQPLENCSHHLHEIFRKSHPYITNTLPIWQGNKLSLLNWLSTQLISSSMYSGAGTFKGVFTFCPSAQRY